MGDESSPRQATLAETWDECTAFGLTTLDALHRKCEVALAMMGRIFFFMSNRNILTTHNFFFLIDPSVREGEGEASTRTQYEFATCPIRSWVYMPTDINNSPECSSV